MVMPLYDDNPFKLPHRPIVTWILIVANIAIFLAEVTASDGPDEVVVHYGVTPGAVFGNYVVPDALPPSFTLVSYMFLHADAMHLFGNMIFLWVFGDNVEEAMGRWRFLAFYLLCGIVGALAFALTDVTSQSPLIGASGAIAGVVIAYLMLRPCAKIIVLLFGIPMRISAYWVIGVFIAIQFINLGSASASEVAYWCHIGGMAAGAVLFPLLRLPGVVLFECIRAPGEPIVVSGSDSGSGANGPWSVR
jgi:membrane associated rhomboid family serine protease